MSPKPVKTVGSKPPALAGAADAGVAEAIVGRALLRVGEHGVRLGRFLELLLGGLVAGIAVRVVLQRQLAVGALDLDSRSPSARRRGPRSSRACSRLRHLHHRRPQQPVAEHVAARSSPMTSPSRCSGLASCTTAWCTFGSKSAPSASIGVTPRLRSRSCSFCVNQLDALAIARRRRRRPRPSARDRNRRRRAAAPAADRRPPDRPARGARARSRLR